MQLFTIGHSNHPFSKFADLLNAHGIGFVVDVRTVPMSRYNVHFNRENLESDLEKLRVEYAFAGKFLGGRPPDPLCYKSRVLPREGTDYLHEVDYPEVMKRNWFQKGIQRLLEIAAENNVAIMCSEENPAECHRHHLIAKYILDTSPEVHIQHIRGNGIVIKASTLRVSMDSVDVTQPSLFG